MDENDDKKETMVANGQNDDGFFTHIAPRNTKSSIFTKSTQNGHGLCWGATREGIA